ncbi:MAG: rRNA maturation RNase YbeY [Pseudomonadota bacterium]
MSDTARTAPATSSAHVVDVDGEALAVAPEAGQLAGWVRHALEGVEQACEVGVQVVSEATIQALNAQYRQRPTPTNVLSFPAQVPAPLEVHPLGDIVVCADVVAREAREGQIDEQSHWAHMMIHGTLHLLGYDHEVDADAEVMESRERSLMRAAGFADPYAFVDADEET